MTKSQLIERIAQRAPRVPRREVEAIVNTVFDSMIDALKGERRIEIRGFGSFAVKVREARTGRNPKTGQKVDVPRRRTPYFTVGKELRDRLNKPTVRGTEPDRPAGGGPPGVPLVRGTEPDRPAGGGPTGGYASSSPAASAPEPMAAAGASDRHPIV